MKGRSGFTLVELLLALALFTIIGIATTRHIQQISNTKTMAFQEIDFYNEVRTTLNVLRSDLSQSFHVQLDDLGEETKKALEQNRAVAHTIFDGRKNELIFTSLSHRVYYAGKRETDQTEISYFLQTRANRQFPSFMKRESEMVDADLYQGGVVYTILDNVAALEFEFLDDKTGKWVQDWNSEGGAYRDRFPQAVRVKLELVRSDNQRIKIATEIKLAFPNNEPFLATFQ